MNLVQTILQTVWPPASVVLAALLLILFGRWIAKRSQVGMDSLLYQLFTWLTTSIAIIWIIILLPLSDESQGQILSLMGVVITAVIAIASTTFVSNMIAGIMLQATQPFRPGDYVRVADQFGRVTKRSLVHTQIQTEWRDLTNLPNLLLVNNPVTVLHREGSVIYTEISLSYDVTYLRVEELLLAAGQAAKLEEPFVLVHDLQDHAVVYRICGFLTEMKYLVSARSNLRKRVLEQMHGNDIEIVSPSFMNQRALDPAKKVIPDAPVLYDANKPDEVTTAPEEKIFDMAEEAASIEDLKKRSEDTRQELKKMRAEIKAASVEEKELLERKVKSLETRESWYSDQIKQREKND
jgi:small conductance mechanosensitive channel